ncbi:MAG: hypothetical protein HY962_04340 [Ignavibacteriae bacterium]|nr:hypothetical protein [Ignavibacteriota bacterium]
MTHTHSQPSEHPPEREIERFVLGISDSEQSGLVRAHLAECSFCAETADVFRAAHAALSETLAQEPPAAVFAELEAIGAITPQSHATTLEMLPVQRRRTIHGAPPPTIALAAQDVDRKPRFVAIQTLATGDESTLLRIMADNVEHGTILQIVSDYEVYMSDVVLEFSGGRGMYITDATGEVRLPHSSASTLTGGVARLHAQRARGRMEAGELTGILSLDDGSTLETSAGEAAGTLRIRHRGADAAVDDHALLVETPDGGRHLVPFTQGEAMLPAATLTKGGHLTVY